VKETVEPAVCVGVGVGADVVVDVDVVPTGPVLVPTGEVEVVLVPTVVVVPTGEVEVVLVPTEVEAELVLDELVVVVDVELELPHDAPP